MLDIKVEPNTSEEVFAEHIKAAAHRDLPWLLASAAHDGHAVICGGGPSLADCVEEIRHRKALGQTVFALNGAARFLNEHGIRPDYQVMVDARPGNVALLGDADCHLIASQCHPDVIDAANWRGPIVIWHAAFDGILDLFPKGRHYTLISAGSVVGISALNIVYVMGFRSLHLYGYDSSHRNGEGHAYPQDDPELITVTTSDGQEFAATVAMARQAETFPQVAEILTSLDCSITVHGDGLLPHIAHLMHVGPDPSAACYDLTHAPASWDFAVWLANAEMTRCRVNAPAPLRVAFSPGPNGGFREDGLPGSPYDRFQMLDNVCRPLLDLYGAIEDRNAVYGGGLHSYMLRPVSDAARAGEEVPAPHAPPWAVLEVDQWLKARGMTAPIVITLREASHWPERNSNYHAWWLFSTYLRQRGYQVIWVRDTERAHLSQFSQNVEYPRASLDVRIRAALYERAAVNLMVCNGPMALLYFGTRPFLIFKPLVDGYKPATADWWAEQIGVPVGGQYPWARPDQRIVWADDTLDEIQAAWSALQPLLRGRDAA